jgi:hypothetical protein
MLKTYFRQKFHQAQKATSYAGGKKGRKKAKDPVALLAEVQAREKAEKAKKTEKMKAVATAQKTQTNANRALAPLVLLTQDVESTGHSELYQNFEIMCMSGKTILVSAQQTATVEAIKQVVENAEGIPVWQQTFQVDTSEDLLKNESTVLQFANCSTIYLIKDIMLALHDHACSHEQDGGSWDGGADSLIRALSRHPKPVGGLLNIDAHNHGDGNHDAALFSAHFLLLPDQASTVLAPEPVDDIRFDCVNNETRNWSLFYRSVVDHVRARGIQPSELISVSFSTNCAGRGVSYVFYHAHPSNRRQRRAAERGAVFTRNFDKYANGMRPLASTAVLQFLHTTATDWEGAAAAMAEIVAEKLPSDSLIVNIDAHSDSRTADAKLSVHYWVPPAVNAAEEAGEITDNAAAVGVDVQHRIFRSGDYQSAYQQADSFIKEEGMCAGDVISLTSCCSDSTAPEAGGQDGSSLFVDSSRGGVALLFYYGAR